MATYPVPPSFDQELIYNVQLDDNPATLVIYYQPFGKRLYFRITDQTGILIVNLPMITAEGVPNLLKGFFTTSTMSYSSQEERVVILP